MPTSSSKATWTPREPLREEGPFGDHTGYSTSPEPYPVLLRSSFRGIFGHMKTASVQQVPQQWPEILRWVAAGEEVQVTQQDRVVARVVPARPVATPDFLARATAVWGGTPPGKALSAVVSDARGDES